MGFLLSAGIGADCWKPPFDIAGDLDTPVSAFMKLTTFAPRFLLESVEGGERLARYSFIGFGNGLEVRLDRDGFSIGGERRPIPSTRRSCWLGCGQRCSGRRSHYADIAGVPLAGGLVGYSSYDVGALLRAPAAANAARERVPALHYVAPRSLLVFDHLTRGIALRACRLARRSGVRLRNEMWSARCAAACRTARARASIRAPVAGVQSRATTWRASGARRNTSPPETFISWCCPRASPAATSSIPSRPIALCGSSTPRPTCITAHWAMSRSSAPRPRRW